MNPRKFSEALGEIDGKYLEDALSYQRKTASSGSGRHRFSATLVAAIILVLAMSITAAAAVILHGDLWLQKPADDPVEVVRSALENQSGKDYTIQIDVESVALDEAETQRVVEHYIKGAIAEWNHWSDEYLAEHFAVVKAVYYAAYDHTQTTRSDGDVTMYFYLTQDEDSGAWTIIDNSGNVNLSEDTGAEISLPADGSTEDQIFSYLSSLFTKAYAPYYDGLHYKISEYEETTENGTLTATFFWTMYHIAKGYDVASDEGVEQDANFHLQVTASLDETGKIDGETLAVLADSSVGLPEGPTFDTPIEDYFPTQLASEKEQLLTYLSDLFNKAYTPYYDGLHYEISMYTETLDSNEVKATFLWTMYFLGKGWDIREDEGVEQEVNWYLQATAAVDDNGTLDFDTISVLADSSAAGEPNYDIPIEEFFPTQLTEK